jgi:1,4-alpha-glucan branching enzyme
MVHVDETGKTTFTFRHSTPGPVHVVGDFCHWQTDHLPMRQASEHEWVLMLRLPPGSYEFRYLANGQWFTDYAAFGVNPNQFREFNSVLRVPRVRPVVPSAARTRRSIRARLAVAARLRALKSA